MGRRLPRGNARNSHLEMTTSEAKFSIRFDSLDVSSRSSVLITEMSEFHSACVVA